MTSVSKFDEILNRIKEFENIVLELKSEFLELQKKEYVQSEAESTLKFLQEYFDFDDDEFNIESTQAIIDALKSGKQIVINDLYVELRLYRYIFVEKSVSKSDIISRLRDNTPFSSLSSWILSRFTNLSIENLERIKGYDGAVSIFEEMFREQVEEIADFLLFGGCSHEVYCFEDDIDYAIDVELFGKKYNIYRIGKEYKK